LGIETDQPLRSGCIELTATRGVLQNVPGEFWEKTKARKLSGHTGD
jgi:hypothetical protein